MQHHLAVIQEILFGFCNTTTQLILVRTTVDTYLFNLFIETLKDIPLLGRSIPCRDCSFVNEFLIADSLIFM